MTSMNGKELESINTTVTCDKEVDKHKETFIVYDNKSEEKTTRTSENKEKVRDGYVLMYEWGKH